MAAAIGVVLYLILGWAGASVLTFAAVAFCKWEFGKPWIDFREDVLRSAVCGSSPVVWLVMWYPLAHLFLRPGFAVGVALIACLIGLIRMPFVAYRYWEPDLEGPARREGPGVRCMTVVTFAPMVGWLGGMIVAVLCHTAISGA